ncbi:MAG TPA: acyltransferase [Flavobacteriales bacterium]|nr:acyltransferase [Flavobacteriales bacterium]
MPSHGSGIPGRIFGLDVMRATAGIMVLLSHTSHLVAGHWPRFPLVPSIDWVGIFFVLSGYLIGALLLDALSKPGPPALRFADFMQRRWLRTLPNYYLFLGINIVLVHRGLAPGTITGAAPAYLLFLQNLYLPLDLFFWESWSLAVEEWFYLLFPLLAFGALAFGSSHARRSYAAICALFLAFPLLARFHLAPHAVDAITTELWLDKLVVTRLDAPGMGMLAALIATGRPAGWRRMRWPAFLIGAVLLALMGDIRREAPLPVPLFNSMEAMAVALLLPLLSTWHGRGTTARLFAFLSLITYALYLVHLPLLYVAGHLVPDPGPWACALKYALFIAAAMGLATLVQRFWEEPFMRQRDRVGRWVAAWWPRGAGTP